MKSSTIAIILIVLVAAAGFWYWNEYMQTPLEEPQVPNETASQNERGASLQVQTGASVQTTQTGTAEDDQGLGDASQPGQ